MTLLPVFMSAAGWTRLCARDPSLVERVAPILMSDDGTITRDGQVIGPADLADCPAAWFGPELFGLGLDEAFLRVLLQMPNLDWLQSGRAGLDHPLLVELSRKGIRIARSNGPAAAIGEYVLAAALDHFQRGPERRAAQQRHEWLQLWFTEVSLTRWALVGYGEIGREIARRAKALGAHVTGIRRSGGTEADLDALITPDAAGEALASADVTVLSVPLTPESEGAYSEAFFASLKPGCLFINIGRGPLIDEDALRQALNRGQIGHAVLDVTTVEPLPADAWHWDHPRVTVTAHTSGIGSGLLGRTDALFLENLGRFVAGAPLLLETRAGA